MKKASAFVHLKVAQNHFKLNQVFVVREYNFVPFHNPKLTVICGGKLSEEIMGLDPMPKRSEGMPGRCTTSQGCLMR
jgi:hypothetical protein